MGEITIGIHTIMPSPNKTTLHKFNLKDKNGACENWNKALELGAKYAKDKIAEHCK